MLFDIDSRRIPILVVEELDEECCVSREKCNKWCRCRMALNDLARGLRDSKSVPVMYLCTYVRIVRTCNAYSTGVCRQYVPDWYVLLVLFVGVASMTVRYNDARLIPISPYCDRSGIGIGQVGSESRVNRVRVQALR